MIIMVFNLLGQNYMMNFGGPSYYEQLKEVIFTCQACQIYPFLQKLLSAGHISINYLFEYYSLNYIDPFPPSKSGNKYILLGVENFTRYLIAAAIKASVKCKCKNSYSFYLYKYIYLFWFSKYNSYQ